MDKEKLAKILSLRNAEPVTVYAWYLANGLKDLPELMAEIIQLQAVLAASREREKQLHELNDLEVDVKRKQRAEIQRLLQPLETVIPYIMDWQMRELAKSARKEE